MKSYDRSKWEKVELSKVGSIITGSTPSRNNPEFWGGDFCWVTAVDFQSKYIFTSEEKLSDQGKKVCRVLPPNTVLVTCIASIGLNAITKCESATNQQINAIVCDTKFYDPEFIYYAIEAYKFDLINLASKTAVPIINKTQFERFCIAVPDLKEQNKIAETLSNIDSHISNLEKLISKQENIKKSTEKMLLTPKPGWKEVKIQDCLDYEQPTDYIVHTDINASSGATPVLTANKAFVLGYTDETNNIYNKGDTIIYDDFTMDMKYVTFPFKVKSSAMKILTPKGENNLYFMFALLKSFGLTQQEHARSYISKLEPMKILIPDPATQETIAENLYTIDSCLEKLKHQLDKIKKLKQGLMSYFFG